MYPFGSNALQSGAKEEALHQAMIRSRLKRLRLEKEEQEGRKLSNRVIAQETGLSEGAILRISNSAFTKVSTETLDRLCVYFNCTVGDLLEFVPGTAASAAVAAVAVHPPPPALSRSNHGQPGHPGSGDGIARILRERPAPIAQSNAKLR